MALKNIRHIFAQHIARLRKEKGWTQHDLAAHSNIPVATLRGYEQERFEPRLTELSMIAEALGVNIADLVEDGETRHIFSEQETIQALSAVDALLEVLEKHAPEGAFSKRGTSARRKT